jgi:hypothetical protein
MDSAWRPKVCNVAAENSAQVEEVDLDFPDVEFEEMLVDDGDFNSWANTLNWV